MAATGIAPPVVCFVGKGDSGKTTLLEGVIAALAERGWRVATVKHHVHDFEIDVPGKDSWRHARAGAAVTMVSSPDKFGMTRRVDREYDLDELAGLAGDVDILLAEGFKRSGRCRIEVARSERSRELICAADELVAIATDDPALAPEGVPALPLSDPAAVADFVEAHYLRGSDAGSAGATARSSAGRSGAEGAEGSVRGLSEHGAPADPALRDVGGER